MNWIFRKRHTKIGASPGTLVVPDEAPPPQIYMFHYNQSDLRETKVEDAEELRQAFSENTVTWVDLQGFGDLSLLHKVGEVFDLHPLLLADMVNVPQRPKSEAYGDQLLIIVRMVRLDGAEQIEMEQVSVVLGPSYVITFQERPGDVLDPIRKRIRSGKGLLFKYGADYLAYAVVDAIVDAYYPVLEVLGDHLELLEDQVVEHPTPELLGQLNRLKNRLVHLRRGIWPEREALNSLVRGDFPAVSEEVRIHFRDTFDHAVQTSEVTEMYREMVTGLMNTYLSAVANRTNEVMRVLTIVATIFIPLTFLAGVYGMNFDHMPELHYRIAYPLVWSVMVAVGLGMTYFFWHKGWLGQRKHRSPSRRGED